MRTKMQFYVLQKVILNWKDLKWSWSCLPVDQLRSVLYVFIPWVIAPPLSNFDNSRRSETAIQFLASAYFVYVTKCNIDPQAAMKCKAYISSKDLFMSNTCATMYEIVVAKFATIRVWIVLLHCPVSSNKPGVTTQIYCHSVDGSNSKALKDRPVICLLDYRCVFASF